MELPDGHRFEQYVLRLPKAATTVVVDERDHVLMLWRHRFVIDRWVWELPGGYVRPGEEPAQAAAREVEEETGWRPRSVEHLLTMQPTVGSADAENLVFFADGAECIGEPTDVNEAARIDWIRLDSIRDRISNGDILGGASIAGLLHVLAFQRDV